jgi:hypothetical protein
MTVVTSSPEKRFDLRGCREIAFQRGVGPLDRYELRDQQTASDADRSGGQDFLRLDEHPVPVGCQVSYFATIDPAGTSW